MANKGKIDEIIDIQAVENQISTTNKMLDLTIGRLEKAAGNAAILNETFKNSKGIKELSDAQKTFNEETRKAEIHTENLRKAQINREKAELALLKASEKNKKAAEEELSEYQKLVKQYNEAAKTAKDLAALYGVQSEQAKQAAKTALDFSNKLKEIDASVGQNQRSVGDYAIAAKSLKLELRENIVALAKMKAAGEDNTEAYQKLLKVTGELQDTINDTREEVKKYASDTQTLDEAIGIFKGLGSAAQAAEGAMQLFGSESEDVQRGIQKMVAIQSILNGVQEIGNALQKESSFMMGVNSVKTKVMAASQYIYTTAVGTSVGAMKAFKVALLASGIGAVIVGLGYLASKMGLFGDETMETTQNIDYFGKAIDSMNKKSERTQDLMSKNIELMKAQGKSGKEIYDAEVKMIQAKNLAITKQIAFYEAGKKTDEDREKLAQLRLQKQLNNIDLQILSYNRLEKIKEEKTKNEEKNVKESNVKIKAYNDEKLDEEIDYNAKGLAALDRKNEEEKKGYNEVQDLVLNNLNERTEKDLLSIEERAKNDITAKEETEKREKAHQEKMKSIREAAFDTVKNIAAGIAELVSIGYENDLQNIDDKSKADEDAKQKELERAGNNQEQKDQINKKYEAREKQRENERKKIERDKAIAQKQAAIFSIILDTAKAIVSHLTTPWLIPFDVATGAIQLAVASAAPIPKYKKGRKGGKGEIAIVGEEGTEAIQLASGKTYLTPDKETMTYLPAGASVIPNHELRKSLAYQSIESNSFNGFVELKNEVKNLQKGFEYVANAYKNKQETHLNITENGFYTIVKNGNSQTTYINNRFKQ